MGRKATGTAVLSTDDLSKHPAVQAWKQLDLGWANIRRITILKEHVKSAVYRLEGVGPLTFPVIAKRCQRSTAILERTLYEKILPHVGISKLDYYGYFEEPDGQFAWLFLEDAGEVTYLSENKEHRILAARWLAGLHAASPEHALTAYLPDRRAQYYLTHLHSGHKTIRQCLANPALKIADIAILESILVHLEALESCWEDVEQLCDELPNTLVHGDFIEKNLRLRNGPDGMMLLPFDWETAGWGVPAVDFETIASDMRTYCESVQRHSSNAYLPSLKSADIASLEWAGKMFRYLASIDWAACHLHYTWVERSMWKMKSYEILLTYLVSALPWKD